MRGTYSGSPENGGMDMARTKHRNVSKRQAVRQKTGKTVVNRKYKDTIFRMLFSNKRNLLSLYNALNGRNYEDPEELEIVTLENAVYMGMKNDLAFILDLNLFLFEHQSTYNPNIPLRDLLYIASEYQKLVTTKSLYASSIVKIPAPRFVVFYNGERKIGEYMEHRLSEAYENLTGDPALELKVVVINVNDGYNQQAYGPVQSPEGICPVRIQSEKIQQGKEPGRSRGTGSNRVHKRRNPVRIPHPKQSRGDQNEYI